MVIITQYLYNYLNFSKQKIKDPEYLENLYKFYIFSKYNDQPINDFSKEFNEFSSFYEEQKKHLHFQSAKNQVQIKSEITQMVDSFTTGRANEKNEDGMVVNIYPHLQPELRKIKNIPAHATGAKSTTTKTKNSSKAPKKQKTSKKDDTYFEPSKKESKAEKQTNEENNDIKKLMSDF
ncbi:MAG: hypothetical protein GQ557_00205 [Mycoplasmataceae bacterium]|nr:hypothetical protein [Mycoplasmataceae bacterium]